MTAMALRMRSEKNRMESEKTLSIRGGWNIYIAWGDFFCLWSEDCLYYCSERNNVVVLFGFSRCTLLFTPFKAAESLEDIMKRMVFYFSQLGHCKPGLMQIQDILGLENMNLLRFYATGWLSRLAMLTRGFKKGTIWHYILRGSERLDSIIRIQMAVWRNWRIMMM